MTAKLARALKRPAVYKWLVTTGYFPESYVLPPCFVVTGHPPFKKKAYYVHGKHNFTPKVTEYLQLQFPKTDWTDRTFGIIDPEIHSDIAYTIARNWKKLVDCLFRRDNKVSSYSFPVPLDSKAAGCVGALRSGRMIYEFIEMAENDLAAISYRYRYIVKTDIKNFYPSLYTHSIAWAIHGKKRIRQGNRNNYSFFGNRLDKLFQNANDGCTNGIPIGPAVSDFISEVVLAAVDRALSKSVNDDVVVVRFKDDYRILAKEEKTGRSTVKTLQAALKEYHLQLNADKTEFRELPDGLFRKWVSQYHAVNPNPKYYYSFKRFKEVCLSVIRIDGDNPGCGVIDRFLADVVTKQKHRLRVQLIRRSLPQVISLLLMLARLRAKAFPKVLATIEVALRSPFGKQHADDIAEHLVNLLEELCGNEAENKYLIAWIIYFLRANGREVKLKSPRKFKDPVVRAVCTSRFTAFKACGDFKVFQGVKAAAKRMSMFDHLDVFKPQ